MAELGGELSLPFQGARNKIAAKRAGQRVNGLVTTGVVALALAACSGTALAGTLKECVALYRPGQAAAAIQCVHPLAEAGDAKAEAALGSLYGIANEPTYDAKKHAFWTRKAAEHGDLQSQVFAGYLYRQGEGAPKDLAESIRWFRTAAKRGDQDAEVNLGLMYLKGWGTETIS